MIVKTFSDGSYVEYAAGSFDKWCVYAVNPNKGTREPPRDVHYFDFLKKMSERFGTQKIISDFLSVYGMTGKEIDANVLSQIDQIASTYGDAALAFSKVYTIMYMGMIAEEQKAGTRLGKRIKRLGVHKLLVENNSVHDAANFMRGMRWREIDAMCRERGF